MDALKSVLNIIVSGARRVDVDVVYGLLLFYLAMSALLLLIKIIREVRA